MIQYWISKLMTNNNWIHFFIWIYSIDRIITSIAGQNDQHNIQMMETLTTKSETNGKFDFSITIGSRKVFLLFPLMNPALLPLQLHKHLLRMFRVLMYHPQIRNLQSPWPMDTSVP